MVSYIFLVFGVLGIIPFGLGLLEYVLFDSQANTQKKQQEESEKTEKRV